MPDLTHNGVDIVHINIDDFSTILHIHRNQLTNDEMVTMVVTYGNHRLDELIFSETRSYFTTLDLDNWKNEKIAIAKKYVNSTPPKISRNRIHGPVLIGGNLYFYINNHLKTEHEWNLHREGLL